MEDWDVVGQIGYRGPTFVLNSHEAVLRLQIWFLVRRMMCCTSGTDKWKRATF